MTHLFTSGSAGAGSVVSGVFGVSGVLGVDCSVLLLVLLLSGGVAPQAAMEKTITMTKSKLRNLFISYFSFPFSAGWCILPLPAFVCRRRGTVYPGFGSSKAGALCFTSYNNNGMQVPQAPHGDIKRNNLQILLKHSKALSEVYLSESKVYSQN